MTNFKGTILCLQLSFERLQFHWSVSRGSKVQTCKKILEIPGEVIPDYNLSAFGEISGSSRIKCSFP